MKIKTYIITCLVSIAWSLNLPKTLDGLDLLIKQIEKDIDETNNSGVLKCTSNECAGWIVR